VSSSISILQGRAGRPGGGHGQLSVVLAVGGCDGVATGRTGVLSACWSVAFMRRVRGVQCMCMNELVRLGEDNKEVEMDCREGGLKMRQRGWTDGWIN
jgi:hypothetical protein